MTYWITLIFVKFLALGAQLISFLSRFASVGSGTALPGLLIEKFFPYLLAFLTKDFKEIILISGTNGKTTTRALLVKIYEAHNQIVCSNIGGANLLRGIASSLLLNENSRPKAKVAILEVEEATLPKITRYIKPHKLILTNVFRDQLDAYGEIDKTLSYFREAINNIQYLKYKTFFQKPAKNFFVNSSVNKPNFFLFWANRSKPEKEQNFQKRESSLDQCKVYVNKDDKKLLTCLNTCKLPVIAFGLDLEKKLKPNFEKVESVDQTIKFEQVYSGQNIVLRSNLSRFLIKIEGQEIAIETKLPGVYNLYNVLASFAACYDNFSENLLVAISQFEPVFGRGEKINLQNNTLNLFLIKNPAGFQQVLDFLSSTQSQKQIQIYTPKKKDKLEKSNKQELDNQLDLALADPEVENLKEEPFKNKLNLVILINDNIADGKDVSWLWDVDIENFLQNVNLNEVLVGGTRGLDMLIRLEYAKYPISLENYLENFVDIIARITRSTNQEWFILATYTAMLTFRKELSKKTKLSKIVDKGN